MKIDDFCYFLTKLSKIQSNVRKIIVFSTYFNGKSTNSCENNCKKQQNQRKTKENTINEGLLRADGRDRRTGGRGAQVKGLCPAGAVGVEPCILCINFLKPCYRTFIFFWKIWARVEAGTGRLGTLLAASK